MLSSLWRRLPTAPPAPRRIAHRRLAALCGLALLLLAGLLQSAVQPRILDVRYRLNDGEVVSATLPLKLQSDGGGTISADVVFTMGLLTPSTLRFIPDDCLEILVLNGKPITLPEGDHCDFSRGMTVDLRDGLQSGENIASLTITDYGGMGGIALTVPLFSPALLGPQMLVIVGVLLLSWALLGLLPFFRGDRTLSAVFLLAIGIRVIYLLLTPAQIRGHDVDGHIEYILYMTTHLLPPAADVGWETYQPPLYYMLGALWLHCTRLLPSSLLSDTTSLQVLSFVLSGATLLLCAWIAKTILAPVDKRAPSLALLLLATLPSWVFFSARINNDVLTLLLVVIVTAMTMRWLTKGGARLWYACCFMAAIAIWSKANGLAVVPVVLLAVFVRPGEGPFLRRFERACAGAVLVGALVLGVYVPRMADHSEGVRLVGNALHIGNDMRMPNRVDNLFTFDPARFIAEPYNSPWEGRRREFFPEYVYRSAFFGEFDFGDTMRPMASTILAVSIAVLAFAILGVGVAFLHTTLPSLPVLLLGLFTAAAHLCFRINYPFSVSQDFRYSPALALPVAIAAAAGAYYGGRLTRWTATGLILLLCSLTAIFTLLIAPTAQ